MSALVLIKKSSLILVYSERDGALSIPFPPSAVADMEVVDEKAFGEMIQQRLGKLPKPVPVIPTVIALDNDLCFALSVDPTEEDRAVKTIQANTPFIHVAVKTVPIGEKLWVIGTNSDLYEATQRVLSPYGLKVEAVVPWEMIMFHKLGKPNEFDRNLVRRIFEASDTVKEVSFPVQQPKKEKIIVPEKTGTMAKPRKKISVGWIVFGCVAGLYILAMLWLIMR